MKLKGICKDSEKTLIIRGHYTLNQLFSYASMVVPLNDFDWFYKKHFFNKWKKITSYLRDDCFGKT